MAPADELISPAVSAQGVECRMISGANHTWASLESELARQMAEFFTTELR
jgi:hypothetical protein